MSLILSGVLEREDVERVRRELDAIAWVSGKRTAGAALKITAEMANEGLITQNEAMLRLDHSQRDPLLPTTIDATGAIVTIEPIRKDDRPDASQEIKRPPAKKQEPVDAEAPHQD